MSPKIKRLNISPTIILVLFLILNGCISKQDILNETPSKQSPFIPPSTTDQKTSAKGSLPVLSKEQVLKKIEKDYRNLKSLKANIQIFFSNANPIAQNCQGYLAYKRPGKISVKGYKELIPNFFTLVMNYPEFWFYVPKYNTVYTGQLPKIESSRGFEIQLDPFLVERALITKPLETNETAEMKEADSLFYLISVSTEEDGLKILKRRLWINRYNLAVEKEITFSAQGIPEIEFTRGDYKKDVFFSMPHKIQFKKIETNESVLIEIRKSYLNPEISEENFEYQPPNGVIIETVN
jgi:outer membrane lipoprotein-sorting protein